jgi:hypothetical protein
LATGQVRTFDAAGNATRFTGQVEEAAGAGWDAAGRMRVFFDSKPSCSVSAFECTTPVKGTTDFMCIEAGRVARL